jgi:hypothetical protein
LKELRESHYWLRLILKSALMQDSTVVVLIEETRQTINIIAKSLITAKKKKRVN